MIKINSFYIVYWSSCFQIIKHHWPKKNLFVKRKKLSFRRQGTLKNGSTQNALSSFGNEREIPHLNFGNNSSLIWRYINFLLPRPYHWALCDKETIFVKRYGSENYPFLQANLFEKWPIHGLLFFIQLTVNKCSLYIFAIFPDDWIQTADLWCRKQPLYQLSHNHGQFFTLSFYSNRENSIFYCHLAVNKRRKKFQLFL